MNENKYVKYAATFTKAVKALEELYNQNEMEEESVIRKRLYSEYARRKLDPDGKAVRKVDGITCTADGLHSICRICNMEENVEDIVSTYKKYREVPIFFFPSENGGINTSRASILGDKIDQTLLDLKLFYSKEYDKCRLMKAYRRPKTKAWLEAMGSFENIVEWWGVREIFTDLEYNIYDLDYDDKILDSVGCEHTWQNAWSLEYYDRLKDKVDKYKKRLQN